jgi:hypothetical protein
MLTFCDVLILKNDLCCYISIWDFSDIESRDFDLVNIRVSMHWFNEHVLSSVNLLTDR